MIEENKGPERDFRSPVGQEAVLRSELERARSGNKMLKIAAIVLSALFLLVAGAAFYIYNRITQTRAALEEAFQNPPSPFPGYLPESGTLPSSGSVEFSSIPMPASSLGLFPGSIPGSSPAPFNAEEAGKVYDAFAKYADRPVVKEIMADLKKNPDIARAFMESKGNDPFKMMASVRGAKGLDKIAAKYALRPDFLKLLMDVMKEPAIKPLMNGLPGGLPLPGAVIQRVPQGRPADESSGGGVPMTLDAEAVSGTPAARPVSSRSKKVSLPVDSE
jgi:hypothetical protein